MGKVGREGEGDGDGLGGWGGETGQLTSLHEDLHDGRGSKGGWAGIGVAEGWVQEVSARAQEEERGLRFK